MTIEDSVKSKTQTPTNTLRHSQLFTENRQPTAKHESHINKIVDASHKIFDHERRQYIQDLRNAEQKLVAAKRVEKRLASKILRRKQTYKNEIIRLKDAIDEKDGSLNNTKPVKASEASILNFALN